jgi:preprotein translocase subunit YajC
MIANILFTLAQTPAPAPGGQPGGIGSMLVPFICIGVIFYFLIIRPQRTQQKKHAAMLAAIKTGDKVVTNGGVHGMVSNVKDGPTLILKVDDNCKLTIDKAAIATILKD